jgi:murein DD-endopeptidase MepM/ murein hydrolase activator NlpD
MNVHQGVDIIGAANEFIIAIANGKVLETSVTACEGPSVVIDHGVSLDNKKLITIYSHVGEFAVKEGDTVKRGDIIAKLPKKIDFPCMARVRHLHLQIGQKYCEKEEKNTWGCNFYIKDLYSSLNPNDYWADGPNKVTCFNKNRKYKDGTLTYPFKCNKIKL